MTIHLNNLGKRFGREWIFRSLDLELQKGDTCVFVGPNGSGKSTLLQVISGVMPRTEGNITYLTGNKEIEEDNWYKNIVIAAPYLELIEDFSPKELLDFHIKFKPFKKKNNPQSLLEKLELDTSANKPIKYFSSGMKQRLKLGLAFASEASILMLDEPTANLDTRWSDWYKTEVQQLADNQITIICSNIAFEYDFCKNIVNLSDCKAVNP